VTEGTDRPVEVTAILTTFAPREELGIVLDQLERLPVDEVIIAVNGPDPDVGKRDLDLRLIRSGTNLGIMARNRAAKEARGEFLLMLDDDSYPLPGAIETLVAALRADPRLGVAAGLVRDVDLEGGTEKERGSDTFDWWLGGGRSEEEPGAGMPAFFFAEGASIVRREAFLEVGGFFEPYFHTNAGLDITTQLIGRGWDVRYFPSARFVHLKAEAGRDKAAMLRRRVRNQLWYFYRHFPAGVAARRIPAYLLFDLLESAKSGALRSWPGGVGDAWRERAAVRGTRRPLPRDVIRRAELNRGRLHVRLLGNRALQLVRRSRKT
jgi:N-acetylglucosaminyl-diphospho-decaprenol L-rhamnosyltransferase